MVSPQVKAGDWSVQVGVGFYHFPGLFLPPCLITEYINNVHKQYPQTHTHTHTPASQTSRHSHLKHQYPLYSKHKKLTSYTGLHTSISVNTHHTNTHSHITHLYQCTHKAHLKTLTLLYSENSHSHFIHIRYTQQGH